MTTVRPAVSGDMPGLLAIEEEFRGTGTPEYFLFDDAWFTRKIEREELLVADNDGIVGYVMWTSIWRAPWIEFIRVLKDRRREGAGRALVAGLEDRLRAAGGWLLISSSAGTDKDAIAWHRAVGFKDGGRIQWAMFGGRAPEEVLHFKNL
jgi:L-amino acid N-acyltransferase YncA